MTLSKKKLAWILAGVLALHLVIAGAKRMGDFMAFFYGNHPNNYFSLLAANGWQEVEVIEDVASPVSERHGGWAGCTGLTRVLLAEKAGKTHLICVDRSHLEDWSGPSEAEALEGEFAGLERNCFSRYPLQNTYGGFGEQELIMRWDWFYYGSNAAALLDIPDEALPQDATVQIWQRGAEYVLHFTAYLKKNEYRDGGFIQVYRALRDRGMLEE